MSHLEKPIQGSDDVDHKYPTKGIEINNQFDYYRAICVNEGGQLCVSDAETHIIQKSMLEVLLQIRDNGTTTSLGISGIQEQIDEINNNLIKINNSVTYCCDLSGINSSNLRTVTYRVHNPCGCWPKKKR